MKWGEAVRGFKEALRNPLVLALLIIVVIVVAATAGFLWLKYDPGANGFCTACHSMVPFYSAIESTPHGAFNCHVCHELTVSELPQLAGELWVYITENPSPSDIAKRAHITMLDQCLACHPQALGDLQIHSVHSGLVQTLGTCTICHNPHNLAQTPAKCQTCHRLDEVLNTHLEFHTYAWQQVQMGNIQVCAQCHGPTATWGVPWGPDCTNGIARGMSCVACHGPTAAPWSPSDFVDCTRCHAK